MSLSNEMSPADYAAITGNNRDDLGGSTALLLIVLFLFMQNGGWNGNNGGWNGSNGGVPYVANDVQRGFDQSAVMGGLNGLTAAIGNGFSDVALSQANQTTGILNAINGLQNQACNNRFDVTTAVTNAAYGLNNTLMANEMARQQCCCDTKQSIADVKYTIATEACADRAAVSTALQEVINNQNRGIQTILDKMCQQEIDAKNETIANLRTQLNMQNLAASQTAQTAQILANNAAQTQALEARLNPNPIPAYVVQNPNCCAPSNGCGCGI